MSSDGDRGRMLTAIGMMSGTSMDGIDVALLRTDGRERVERGPFLFVPYPEALRRRIEQGLIDAEAIERRTDRPGTLAALEVELTDRHAAAVRAFLAANDIRTEAIDLIGAHGQTVLHRPERSLTVQLLDAGLLARALGVRIVSDIRQGDIDAGGQGAPLVPVYHRALARGDLGWPSEETVAFVNIGGISNVTVVSPDGLVAFDSGPGNSLIDQWMQREAGIPYDDGGRIAGEGKIERSFVTRLLDRPFFRTRGPKSLDRSDFVLPTDWRAEVSDGARTLARATAEAIAKHVELLDVTPMRWVVSGGGAHNRVIMDDLRELLDPAEVHSARDLGLDGDAMEAEAWAYLAVRVAKGLNVSEPGTTGRRPLSEDRPKFANWL